MSKWTFRLIFSTFWRSLKETSFNQARLLIVLSFVAGFLMVTAFFSKEPVARDLSFERKRELIKVMYGLEEERDSLKKELADLREQVATIEKKAAENEGVLKSYQEELRKVKEVSGLLKAKGPGVVVTLGDNPNPTKGEDPNPYIIHDYDLRVVVNALFSGGAEAVAINNQRIIFISSIRCVGTTILLNAVRLAQPYEIKAIGDPELLVNALQEDPAVALLFGTYAKNFGLITKVNTQEQLEIPAFNGSLVVKETKLHEE